MNNFSEKVSFIWSVADLLRGDYKQSEYGRVILPFTVLKRLDDVLELTEDAVLEAAEKYASSPTRCGGSSWNEPLATATTTSTS